MSLATRCSACGTVFRVVEDQLKISEGWVRCGRCDTVFDALETMVDLPAQPLDADPSDSDPPFSQAADRPIAAAQARPVDTRQLLVRRDAGIDEIDELTPPPSATRESEAIALATTGAAGAVERADPARDHAAAPSSAATAAGAAAPYLAATTASSTAATVAPAAPPDPRPSFLQQADRDAHWHNPAMRAALLGTSMILLLTLTAQVVYHQRDAIAARSTWAAGWLQRACERWNCRIEAPRSIGDMTIENSALTRLDAEGKAVRLTLTIRNRGSQDLAMPAVELSLTDFEGRLIARKALLPADFRVEPPVVAANAERPVQVIVRAGENRIAGYTVELFYP